MYYNFNRIPNALLFKDSTRPVWLEGSELQKGLQKMPSVSESSLRILVFTRISTGEFLAKKLHNVTYILTGSLRLKGRKRDHTGNQLGPNSIMQARDNGG